MNILDVIQFGAKMFKAPPHVLDAIDKFAGIYKEFNQRGYNDRNLPPKNVIGDVLEQFNVSREDIKKNLFELDKPSKLTNAMNMYAPGILGAVKEYANSYAGESDRGDNGNVAGTHNTITGRRKLPKIR